MEEEFVPLERGVSVGDLEGDQTHALITDTTIPWLPRIAFHGNENPLLILHSEIVHFSQLMSLSEAEMATRENIIDEIRKIAQKLFPDCHVHPFGSHVSKILTPKSDLDIAIVDVPQSKTDPLYLLADAFRSQNIATYIEVVSGAKIPIVKFDHVSGVSVDVLCNNRDGIQTAKLMKKYVREFPPLKPLTVLLKIFLGQRKLNETYTGGVGSFVLCVLIVSFLQMRMKSAVSYTRSGHTSGVSWNLGSLLLDFFHLYGVSFNYQDLGISIRDGGSYFSKMHRVWSNAGRQSILCIENPDYPDIDMGKNSFQMFKVRKAFEHGHQVLLVALQNRNTLSRRQNLSNYSVTDAGDDEAPAEQLQPSAEGSGDVSILAHLIRSDDEMLLNRFEEKKELLREWEAIQRRKERHLHSRGEEARSEGGGGGGERQPERKKQRRGEGIDFTVTGYEEARED